MAVKIVEDLNLGVMLDETKKKQKDENKAKESDNKEEKEQK